MKSKYLLIGLLGLAACSQDEVVDPMPTPGDKTEVETIVMQADGFRISKGSRSSFVLSGNNAGFQWSKDDEVGIFPMAASEPGVAIPNEGTQVAFPMAEGAGTNSADFDGGGWALKSDYTYAAYYPLIHSFDVQKTAIPVDFTNQEFEGLQQVTTSDGKVLPKVNLGSADFMTAQSTTAVGGKVNFQFKHTGSLIILKFVAPQKGYLQSVTLSEKSETPGAIFTSKGVIDLTETNVAAKGKVQLPLVLKSTEKAKEFKVKVNNVAVEKGQVAEVYFIMAPEQLKDKTLNVEALLSDSPQGAATSYNASVLITHNFKAGEGYILLAQPVSNQPTHGVYRVDKPGTLADLAKSDSPENFTHLTVSGTINGADLIFIRNLAGCQYVPVVGDENPVNPNAKLTHLDLSFANIVVSNSEPEYVDSKGFSHQLVENDEIGAGLFSCCSLQEVYLPETLKSIGDNAFYESESLTRIILPEGLQQIKAYSLACISLLELVIPSSVRSLAEGSLAALNLSKLTILPTATQLSLSEYAFLNLLNPQCQLILHHSWKDQVVVNETTETFNGLEWSKPILDETGRPIMEQHFDAETDPWTPGNTENGEDKQTL